MHVQIRFDGHHNGDKSRENNWRERERSLNNNTRTIRRSWTLACFNCDHPAVTWTRPIGHKLAKSINRSTKQSIDDYSAIQSINRSINRPLNHSINITKAFNRSTVQSFNHSIHQSINLNHPIIQSINQSTSQFRRVFHPGVVLLFFAF